MHRQHDDTTVCSGTGIQVIALGVEAQNEWQMLQSLGVNGGQGRLFDEEIPLIPTRLKKMKPESKVKLGRRNRWRTK